jgi:hypothetical protein
MARENETLEQGAMIDIAFSNEQQPQGILFHIGGKQGTTRFSPYRWLSLCDYEIAGRMIRLDCFGYDVVLRWTENHPLDTLFAAIAKNECSEVAEQLDALTIESRRLM